MTTRRDFMQSIAVAGASLSLAPADITRGVEVPSASPVDYYEKLGVRKIINAVGAYTTVTASLMPPEVQAAVAFAATHPVRLRDLQNAAGAYIARRLQCEAALVSAGAASALSLGTAACMTVGAADAAKDVPARTGSLKNEVLIQKGHHLTYEHALEMCGARLVEVDTIEDYENAFGPRTAMAFFYNAADEGHITHADWLRIAHAHAVPCFLDAAGDLPPVANLWNYTKMGFDLVAFSGGKGIRGPQNAGLLLGRKDLVEAAAANNSPNNRSIGRGMKVAKEQIVGMVAALDWILAQTDEQIEAEPRRRAERIAAELRGIPTVTTEIVVPAVASHVAHLMVRYDQDRIGIKPVDVAVALREGEPSIELHPATGHTSGAAGLRSDENTVVLCAWMMKPGEDAVVGRRLREVLHAALRS
jgi:L-seryl-tRNA(Ser) seleniumtransferase